MRVKIQDVARRADVSTATVSLALNGSEKVNPVTRKRVMDVAREMGYRPNPNAKRLAMRRSRQIGLIVPDIENQYYAALAQHTLNELLASDYALTISTSMNSPGMEKRIVSDMIAGQVEGLLIAPVERPNDDPGYLSLLDGAGIPYLFVTSSYPGPGHGCVMCDLYDGMRRLLEVLWAKGYTRLALLSGAANAFCFERRDGAFLDFAREKGLGAPRVYHLEGVRYDHAYAFARTMPLEGVEALVCVNDMMALGVVNALRERGVAVPGDVAVAGFDDSIFSRVSPVSITTVRQDVHAMAALSAEWILRLARGEAEQENATQLIPCEVVVRESTG